MLGFLIMGLFSLGILWFQFKLCLVCYNDDKRKGRGNILVILFMYLYNSLLPIVLLIYSIMGILDY